MTSKKAYPAAVIAPHVQRQEVSVWFNGVRLDADLYRPTAEDGALRAAVVLSHGLGGDKRTAERYAAAFAAEGMICLSFTHAGWGASQALPAAVTNAAGSRDIGELREVVDPLQWVQACICAIDFIEGEPGVDPQRIGLWGTSFGGGVAAITAAGDERKLFRTEQNGARAAQALREEGNDRVGYHVVGGIDHYGVYFDGYEESCARALQWFQTYL